MEIPRYLHSSSWQAFLLALPAVLYVVIRASVLTFTYDECWTFLGYASKDVWSIMSMAEPAANNHILHSLLLKCCTALFDNSLFVMRLPAVLAFLGFCYFAHRVSSTLFPSHRLMVFLILVYQPYLLDYFSMARGYGLALMGTLGALHFLQVYLNHGKSAAFAIGFAMIAAYANFTYLLVLLAVISILVYVAWTKKTMRRIFGQVAISASLFIPMVYAPILRLIEAGELYYGGQHDFFHDTLLTLANRMLYDASSGLVLAVVFALLLMLSGYRVLKMLFEKSSVQQGEIVLMLALLTALGSIAQHFLLGSPYLIDRTAIFFIPLLMLACVYLASIFLPRPMARVFTSLVLLGVLTNMVAHMNVSFQLDFKEFADVDQAMQRLKSESETTGETFFALGKSKYMNAPIMFYKKRLEVDALQSVGLEYCDEKGAVAYYYLFAKDLACVEGKHVEQLAHYIVSDTYLYRALE